MTKLRISAHSLAIETGRYNNTLKKQRFCKHCPTSVENESHFILYCSRFDNLRLTSDYIFPSSRVDADLIKDILNPSNINNAKLICRFLKEANATMYSHRRYKYRLIICLLSYMFCTNLYISVLCHLLLLVHCLIVVWCTPTCG